MLDARQELYGESDPATFDAMLRLRPGAARRRRPPRSGAGADRVGVPAEQGGRGRRPPGALDRVQPGHRPRPARRPRGVPPALGARAGLLRPRRGARQRALPADGHQPGHHAAQAPPLRGRVPAPGARARIGRGAPSGPTVPRPSGPRSTWPRRTATSATTTWRWTCSARPSPAWSAPEATSGRSCTRSGPSPRSWWPSSGRTRPPPCSTRSWPAPWSIWNPTIRSGAVRCGNGGATGWSGSSPGAGGRKPGRDDPDGC